MNLTNKKVALFKASVTSSMPIRPGAVQCVRNCSWCILKRDHSDQGKESEDMICIKSFDNLNLRKSLWFSKYQSFQYHAGQIDVLKMALQDSSPHIYTIFSLNPRDIDYLNQVLLHNQIQTTSRMSGSILGRIEDCSLKVNSKPIAILIRPQSCSGGDTFHEDDSDPWSSPSGLASIFGQIIEQMLKNSTNPCVVPVTVSRDHDRLELYGLGSICVQILEPYSLRDYIKDKDETTVARHLVQHLYYDTSRNVAILPTHLIAYLLLYLERENGPEFEDLVYYIDYFRKSSIETGIQLAFTGSSIYVAKYALALLKDFILIENDKFYRPRDYDKLVEYACFVTPITAYYGLISRSLLMATNGALNEANTVISSRIIMKISKEEVMATAQLLAERLELSILCRRPCNTIEAAIEDTFNQMQMFGKYFRIEEPAVNKNKSSGWIAELDFDDDLARPESRGLKTWITLCDRANRLDRLNLFMNSVVAHL